MWREEPVRGRVNIAVVVKAQPITGKMVTGDVVNQLREAFGKKYLDTATTEELTVHECFVVTPHVISKEGSFCLEGLVQNEPFRQHVDYVDGQRLWHFIERYLGSRILLPRLAETFRDIQRVIPDVRIELSSDTLTVRSPDGIRAEPVIVTPNFADTPEGKTHREAFERFVKTGEPAELPASTFAGLPVPEFLRTLGFDPTQGVVRMGSPAHSLNGALTLRSSNGESVMFERVEFIIRGGSERIHLTNAAQGIPFVLDVKISFTNDGRPVGNIHYSSSVEGWSAHWLDRQQKALRIMAAGCTFQFREERTGIEYGLGEVASGLVQTSSERFQELVRQLAWVEEQVKESITIPARPFFTTVDRENLDFVRGVINTGRVPINSATFTITPVPGHRDLLIKALREGAANDLLKSESSSWPILDTHVPLGPAELYGSGARMFPDLLLSEALDAVASGQDVAVRVEPGKGKQLYVRHLWWYNKRRR